MFLRWTFVKWYSSPSNQTDRAEFKLLVLYCLFTILNYTYSIIISPLTKSLSFQFSIWCSNEYYSGCIEPYTCMTIKIGKPASCQNIAETCQCMKSKITSIILNYSNGGRRHSTNVETRQNSAYIYGILCCVCWVLSFFTL